MERFTISLYEPLVRQFDELIKNRGYRNHPEAVRDMLREQLERHSHPHPDTGAIAAK